MDKEKKKRIVLGIFAHVDAGKTTLSEGLLYLSGVLRKQGRVDHGTSFLDTSPMERERGITIFSRQARFSYGDTDFVLLDTPGHSDFGAEAERAIRVLDYAVLLIGGADGVKHHTLTLFRLLREYGIPTFIFVNKMDLPNGGERAVAEELCRSLSPKILPVYSEESAEERYDRFALADEYFLEEYLCEGVISDETIALMTAEERIFPCFFGSALHMDGVRFFMEGLLRFTLPGRYDLDGFGARVYKIARDGGAKGGDGAKLSYLRVTSGQLSVRDEIVYRSERGSQMREKIAQIRLYSGDRFTQVERVEAGEICAVLGLSETYAGQGLGREPDAADAALIPVFSYRLVLPREADPRIVYPKLLRLSEEEPSLRPIWKEESGEILVQLMGDVQIDVFLRTVKERFGLDVSLDNGQILYLETIRNRVEGIGHFEPLRHYAEVHLALEPLPRGSGVVFTTDCPEDKLDRNWQRLILSALEQSDHVGVLIGAPITDMKVTLLIGKAHLAHTDGGDFREAACRALRQGLMQAESVLLEPIYRYRLELPSEYVGRAMNDLQMRHGTAEIGDTREGMSVLIGRIPVSTLGDYVREVVGYTHGKGRLLCQADGYAPCHNTEEVVAVSGYLPLRDLAHPADSVFCAHGGGFTVPWNEVRQHMHVDSGYGKENSAEQILPSAARVARRYHLDDKELEAIMLREFGPIKRRKYGEPKRKVTSIHSKPYVPRKEHLIIDGYNVIHAWDFLKEIAAGNLELAREQLMDILSNYVSYTKNEVTLVFDAYRVKGNAGSEFMRDGYKVVYTAENETGDAYIERLMHLLGPNYAVRVVTADRLVQFSAVHSGILRMTVKEFEEEIARINLEITEYIKKLAES